MTPIHKIIGFTEHDYEMILFRTMLNWAHLYAKSCPQKAQFLLANRMINNWFRKELSKLLKQFRSDLKPFKNQPGITKVEMGRLFITTIAKIYDIYPKSLIEEYKPIPNIRINNHKNHN